jgi:hypothetical protein
MEGPREACAQEGWKCARVYADNHGAKQGVMVNGGDFEFYFSSVPKGVDELDREEALDIHRDAKGDEFDNLQGG